MDVRPGTADDLGAVQRIWRECGWVDSDEDAALIEQFLEDGTTRVAVVDGEAEASGSVHRGTLRHGDVDLDTAVVTSITTSRIGRKQGLARAVLDQLVVDAATDGAAVSVLGMFEQGFYDRSGFGTGGEMVFHRFDPSSLPADLPYRRPVRLTTDDVGDMTAALAARARGHGGVAIPSTPFYRAEAGWVPGGFGLGYRDDDGGLSHFLWCAAKGEFGPYRVMTWAWRTDTQLRELLAVLRSLGDQVHWVIVPEPWCLQLQALTALPARQSRLTKGAPNEYKVVGDAWWQARMLDLPACISVLRSNVPLRLAITVTDPLAEAGLEGVAGDWTLTLTPDGSSAERRDGGEADLTCTVNTLTRLWLGVRHPSAVLATDGVAVDPGVAASLDAAITLPRPDVGIGF